MKPNTHSVLTDGERDRLSDATLGILEEFGIRVTLPEAVDLLRKAGASRGDGDRIRMESGLVKDLLAEAPSRFKLHDRFGGAIEIGSGRSWTVCGGTVSRVDNHPGWDLRPATREDVARFTRLCDALPEVHCVVPVVEAQDVERSRAEAVTFLETISNTTKFVFVCPLEHASARAWVEMGRIAAGMRDLSAEPAIGLLVSVLPSLHLDDDCAATAILAAREGLPLICLAGPMAGSSAPNTVAGSAALKLAGELFTAAFAQIVRPGTPVMMNTGVTVLDMNHADIGEAGPEYPLGVVAHAEVAREFGVPTYACGLHCEAKRGDFQAGLEKMAGMMATVLAGVDLTTNLGMLSRCSAASYEQLLLDAELCAFLERFSRGVTVDGDTLAMHVIREVGLGGDFITHEHTVKHCRSGEIWYPLLLDRSAVGAGCVDLYEKAHGVAGEILENHRPQVDDGTRRDLESLVSSLS